MLINKYILKKFNPCSERYKNYLKNYSDFTGSFDEFIDLPLVTYYDKIWVAKNILNKNQLVHFSILCAESILYIFEDKYPEDKRVGDCLRYLKSINDFNNITDEQNEEILKRRLAAYYATTSAYYTTTSAYYAANAAYYAANTAYYAADAANAAYFAAHAADSKQSQQNLMLEYLKMAASI